MSFELLDLALISIGAIAGVTALVILRLRVEPSEKKEFKKSSSFLVMGGLWFIVGMIFGPLYRGDGVFDSPLLMLGLVFLLAGGFGVVAEYFRR
jgi:multisubunit Na+/H+ antiporter MnhB subunit